MLKLLSLNSCSTISNCNTFYLQTQIFVDLFTVYLENVIGLNSAPDGTIDRRQTCKRFTMLYEQFHIILNLLEK